LLSQGKLQISVRSSPRWRDQEIAAQLAELSALLAGGRGANVNAFMFERDPIHGTVEETGRDPNSTPSARATAVEIPRMSMTDGQELSQWVKQETGNIQLLNETPKMVEEAFEPAREGMAFAGQAPSEIAKPCGCRVIASEILFCPLHHHAEELRNSLVHLIGWFYRAADAAGSEENWIEMATQPFRDLVAKAGGTRPRGDTRG
jgi:hypothetical protein